MPNQVKYRTKEYNEAYKRNQIANSYNGNTDTYEVNLPEVKITPRNNLDLGNIVRQGTSNFIKPVYKTVEEVLDFTPLAPAVAAGRLGNAVLKYKETGDKNYLTSGYIDAAFNFLPFLNVAVLKTPIREVDKIRKTITKDPRFGIDKISLYTPKKGEIASIELSPSNYDDFGKKWLHPEFIEVKPSEQGKGLSNVLYDEGIKFAQKRGYNGVLSGEALLQPNKTIKTQKRFNGPEARNPAEDYPIKGLESPKDPKMSKTIINNYNNANTITSTVGEIFLNEVRNLFKK